MCGQSFASIVHNYSSSLFVLLTFVLVLLIYGTLYLASLKLNPLLLHLRDVYITNSSHIDISMSSCSYAFYHAELLENIFVAGGCKLAVLEDMPDPGVPDSSLTMATGIFFT